jgi:hypothetical protein
MDGLSPSEQDLLRKKYESGGHTQTMSYDDWLDANFADSSVDEVRSAATSTPRIQAGKDPNLLPGDPSRLAKSRVAADKPLPEGRDMGQYSARQKRVMSRNVHSPEVPMNRFGGTFTMNVDGSMSSRAPNPEMLATAEAIAADPEQGAESASYIMALAQAYGIDAQQYGDDMDMLKADVLREQKRHGQLAGKYDIEENGMGGFRYVPSDSMKAKMEQYGREQQAGRIGRRFAGQMTEQEEAELEQFANTPDGRAQMAAMNRRLGRRRDARIAQNVKDRWANINMTTAANNPRMAQGMYMRSLQQAAQTGNPLAVAAVHEAFGNAQAAQGYRELAGVQAQAAADVAAAEAGANGDGKKDESDVLLADRFGSEISAAMKISDPRQRKLAVMAILSKSEFLPPDEIAKEADAIIASAAGGAIPPQHTRTWFEWLFRPRGPVQGSALPPQQQAQAGAAPQAQSTSPAPAPAAPAPTPPASGRGAALDGVMEWLSGNRPTLDQNHPWRRGS